MNPAQKRRSADRHRAKKGKKIPLWLYWVAGGVIFILLLIVLLPPLFEKEIRQQIENDMSQNLDAFTFEVGEVKIHPFSLSFVLHDLVLIQDDFPDPPVANVSRLRAGVDWWQLLKANLLADFLFEETTFHLNMERLQKVVDDDPDERANLFEALDSIHFLDFNLVELHDGELTFIAEDGGVIQLHDIEVEIEDMLVGRQASDELPSAFRFECAMAEGRMAIQGRADLLAKPDPSLSGRFTVEDIALAELSALLTESGVFVSDGSLNASGYLDYRDAGNALYFEDLVLRDFWFDYVLGDKGVEQDAEQKSDTEETVETLEGSDPEGLRLYIDRLLVGGTFGFVNQRADPEYRVFLEDAQFSVYNYSNEFHEGVAEIHLEGLFMGSGETLGTATFRPLGEYPEFDLALEINETQLTSLNDVLLAYGNFDVQDGHFSFFTELSVADGYIDGYMRPLFGDMEVHDGRDEDDTLIDGLYETAIGAITSLMENVPRDEVATQIDISGPLDDPEMSTWEIIWGLIQNAFFEAILPGFESEL